MRTKYLGLLLGFYVFSAQGNIPVTVNNSAKLFAGPTEQSAVITQVPGKAPLRALQQSDDKQWVFVSDGLRFGWIRKSFVTRYTEPEAAVTQKNPPKITREKIVSKALNPKIDFSDDDLPLDDEVLGEGNNDRYSRNRFGEMVDASQGEIFIVRNEGALYEKPLRNADRFGNLESNDQVEFLNLSNDQKWVRVRVLETGEEGWLPRKDIARKIGRSELEELNRLSDRTLHWGIYGVFSPVPWSLGGLGTFSKTFNSLAIADTPLELGAGFGYSAGNTYSQFLTVSYFDFRGYLRWEPRVASKIAIPIDFGLLYKYAIIKTTLSEAEFKAANSRIKLGESGLLFGVGVSYVPNEVVKFIVMPKLQVTSSIDLILDAGVTYSF